MGGLVARWWVERPVGRRRASAGHLWHAAPRLGRGRGSGRRHGRPRLGLNGIGGPFGPGARLPAGRRSSGRGRRAGRPAAWVPLLLDSASSGSPAPPGSTTSPSRATSRSAGTPDTTRAQRILHKLRLRGRFGAAVRSAAPNDLGGVGGQWSAVGRDWRAGHRAGCRLRHLDYFGAAPGVRASARPRALNATGAWVKLARTRADGFRRHLRGGAPSRQPVEGSPLEPWRPRSAGRCAGCRLVAARLAERLAHPLAVSMPGVRRGGQGPGGGRRTPGHRVPTHACAPP